MTKQKGSKETLQAFFKSATSFIQKLASAAAVVSAAVVAAATVVVAAAE